MRLVGGAEGADGGIEHLAINEQGRLHDVSAGLVIRSAAGEDAEATADGSLPIAKYIVRETDAGSRCHGWTMHDGLVIDLHSLEELPGVWGQRADQHGGHDLAGGRVAALPGP